MGETARSSGGPARALIGYRPSGGLADSIVDGVTGILVDDRAGVVAWLEQLLSDSVLRDQLGAKGTGVASEFSLAAKRRSATFWRVGGQCRPIAVLSAAWFEPASTDLILGAARRRVFAVV